MEELACEVCKNWAATGFADGIRRKDLVRELDELDYYIKHRKTHEKTKGNGHPQGAFAFTLTLSPADKLSVGDLLVAVRG